MTSNVAGPEIERLIQLLARLPGLGPRSARRAALHLIRKREPLLGPLAEAMRVAHDRIVACSVCGTVDTRDPCTICADERRDGATLVVVEFGRRSLGVGARQRDARRAITCSAALCRRSTASGPTISISPSLVARVAAGGVKEVVLAVNATVDGQTTAHYVTELLSPYAVKVTRLAHGVPVGGELDYLDDGTLAAAMRQRTAF